MVQKHLVSVLYKLVKENGKYSNIFDKRLIRLSFLLMIKSLFEYNIIFNLQILFRMNLVHQNAFVLATSFEGMKTIDNH